MDAKDFAHSKYHFGCETRRMWKLEDIVKLMEEYAKQKLNAVWNFEGLPRKDKPVLIFREKHTPEVIGAFYEGNIEYGEFHNGERCPERIVYSDVTAWTDVLEAPKLATHK